MATPITARKGNWMQTYTGRAFWPLDPRPEEVDPLDIAHALGMLCRYGGHVNRFYCVTPETRVLTSDLRWVPAGDLKQDDGLLAFDEHLSGEVVPDRRRRRKSRGARVTHTGAIQRRIIRLDLADGTSIRASAEHPWVVARKASRNQSWMTAEQIMTDVHSGHSRYMLRFVPPWEECGSWEDGYLAGMLDGEGHVSFRTGGPFSLGFAQNPGPTLDRVEAALRRRSVDFVTVRNPQSRVMNLTIRGHWYDRAALLGSIRAERLIGKVEERILTDRFPAQLHAAETLRVVGAADEGMGEVVALSTSTGTYFAEGFGAHNSVAEHCILMSNYVEAMSGPQDALWALLHDATEAYVGDVIRPLKALLPAYSIIEDQVMGAICERFGLPHNPPAIVKEADNRILLTERAALMDPPPRAWEQERLEPLPVRIQYYSPAEAESGYFVRLSQLRRRAS